MGGLCCMKQMTNEWLKAAADDIKVVEVDKEPDEEFIFNNYEDLSLNSADELLIFDFFYHLFL